MKFKGFINCTVCGKTNNDKENNIVVKVTENDLLSISCEGCRDHIKLLEDSIRKSNKETRMNKFVEEFNKHWEKEA